MILRYPHYFLLALFPLLLGGLAPVQKSDVEIRAENCAIAKNKVAALTLKPRVRKMNDQGELEVLSPEALKTEIDKARQEVEYFCGPTKAS